MSVRLKPVLENDRIFLDISESFLFRALLYFDLFNFPLTLEEIIRFTNFTNSQKAQATLNKWNLQGLIFKEGKYFMLGPASDKVEARKKAMFRADCMISQGLKNATLINNFPYVRGVFFSGSISKGVVATDGDIDFFIIAKPGRLWLCRTLLALYKKVFLLGSHKFFCINYFIDTRHPEIEEKNIFTATEMITLVPVCGNAEVMHDFYSANHWVRDFYPNYHERRSIFSGRPQRLKAVLEWLLDRLGSRWADWCCQRITTAFWRRKFSNMPEEEFEIALKSRHYVSKHHPRNFQKRILKKYTDRLKQFEAAHNLKLG